MPKDKLGNELTWKEFIERWKGGIQKITPGQQTRMQLRSMNVVIIGILCGIVIATINFDTLWWLDIILVGAFFNTLVQYLGIWQKKKVFDNIERRLEENV